MASSTPDVKSLFNSPSTRYRAPEQRVPEQDEFDDASFYSRSSRDSNHNGGGLHEYAASLSDYSNSANDYSLNDHWINAATPTNAHGSGFQHGLPPPPRMASQMDEAYKRGSDSAIEAKLREKLAASQRQQHNVAARAQSLDLTSLGMTSRGVAPGSGLGETPIDEAGGAEESARESSSSPPMSSMMTSFPTLNDPPVGAGHLMGSIKPRQRGGLVGAGRPVLDTDAVTTDNMHSMFASMNLDSPIR